MEYALEAESLSKNYGRFRLKNVNFKLPRGSIMGFIGENGAGKTTTIKLILGLIKKDSGRISIFGKDNTPLPGSVKNKIGVVMENGCFHEALRLDDIAGFMKLLYKEWDQKQFAQCTKKFGLPEKAPVKEFSKGMVMKLSLAVAMSHHPRLLILDEATSGLDPVARNELADLFLDYIQDENNSIFLSSHITSDIERIADYVTFIRDGEIVFCEAKDKLLNDYGVMKCGKDDFARIDGQDILGYRKNHFGCEALVKNRREMEQKYHNYVMERTNLEEIMLFYSKGESM